MIIRTVSAFCAVAVVACLPGCTTTQSAGPTVIRAGFSPLTNPPAQGKGRMLVRPFTDHHPNGPQDLPGAKDPVMLAADPTLAQVLTEAFASASRFAGYEVAVGTEAPPGFVPDVVLEGDVRVCKLGVDAFAGVFASTQSLGVQMRLIKSGSSTPIWEGSINGSSGGFLLRDRAARLAMYETQLRDSVDSALMEWVKQLDPAAAMELIKRLREQTGNASRTLNIR